MNNIGVLYDNGNGVAKDYVQAMSWYKKADAAGNPGAAEHIGDLLFRRPRSDPGDYAQSINWYRKATNAGSAAAACNVGYQFEKGYGVTQVTRRRPPGIAARPTAETPPP